MQKKILISVDVEEFDIPEEYGQSLEMEQKLAVSRNGLLKTLELFNTLNIRATFFVTAYWAQQHPALLQQIAEKHEIASHAFYHDRFEEADLLHSRLTLEAICGKPVKGFRMPRLQPVSLTALQKAGYIYDASLNPTWLPGRYNNLHRPRQVFREAQLWIMPTSVTPVLRLPVFWLSVKNLPLWFSKTCIRRILRKGDHCSFYFHPWELEDLHTYQLPWYVKRVCGLQLENKLAALFTWLQKEGVFISHTDYLPAPTHAADAQAGKM